MTCHYLPGLRRRISAARKESPIPVGQKNFTSFRDREPANPDSDPYNRKQTPWSSKISSCSRVLRVRDTGLGLVDALSEMCKEARGLTFGPALSGGTSNTT